MAEVVKTSKSEGSSSTSQSLLVGLKDGDPRAWQRLVSLYGPLIYYWCRSADVGPDDTADLVQEVFRKVHGAIGRFRREHEGVSSCRAK